MIAATAWSRWRSFLAEREPGTALALLRISVGVCVVWMFGSIAANGLVPVVWFNPADGGWRPVHTPWLLERVGHAPDSVGWLTGLAIASGTLLILGVAARMAALLALQSVLELTHVDRPGFDDLLLANLLWLLVLARSAETLSIRSKLRTGSWRSSTPVPAWPRRLVVVQLVAMYFAAGLHKATVYWTPADGYSALYYILQSPRWARFEKPWLADVYPLLQFGTAVTWLWEVTAPLLLLALWYRRTGDRPGRLRRLFNRLPLRAAFVAVGLAMHLGIFALMDLGPFSFIALGSYWCLFRFGELTRSETPGRGVSLVAIFVPLHLVAVLVQAAPSPLYVSRADWKQPPVQAEFAQWGERLNMRPDELEEGLWTISHRYLRLRTPIESVFSPYYRFCGTSQAWRMFVAPDLEPTRLEVEVFERGEWRLVYRELDASYSWQAGILEHWRFRVALFSATWSRNWGEVSSLAAWLRGRAAADFPEGSRIRVRLMKWKLLPAREMRSGAKPIEHVAFVQELSLR